MTLPDAAISLALRDGTPVTIRPLLAEDRATLVSGFAELSEESRYSRFLAPIRELTPTMLEHLVDDVDQQSHVALLVAAGDEAIGVGRFVADRESPSCAEIAVTVKDAWQGRGAGSLLVDALVAEAHRVGVTTFTALALATNAATLRLMERTGEVTAREYVGPGAVAIEVAVR